MRSDYAAIQTTWCNLFVTGHPGEQRFGSRQCGDGRQSPAVSRFPHDTLMEPTGDAPTAPFRDSWQTPTENETRAAAKLTSALIALAMRAIRPWFGLSGTKTTQENLKYCQESK